MSTIGELILEINKQPTPKFLRRGQFLYNSIRDKFPEITKELNGTEFDCYYSDDRIMAFIAKAIELYYVKDEVNKCQSCNKGTLYNVEFVYGNETRCTHCNN